MGGKNKRAMGHECKSLLFRVTITYTHTGTSSGQIYVVLLTIFRSLLLDRRLANSQLPHEHRHCLTSHLNSFQGPFYLADLKHQGLYEIRDGASVAPSYYMGLEGGKFVRDLAHW